ncbi:25579_t:CDS:2, partial [Dentiscutata erythropus]
KDFKITFRKKEYKQEAKERRNKKVTVTNVTNIPNNSNNSSNKVINNFEEKFQDNNKNNNIPKETVIYVDAVSSIDSQDNKNISRIIDNSKFSLEITNVSNDIKDETSTTIYTTPKDLLKNQNVWRQKIRAEREADLKKLQETSGILSLSSTKCMIPPDYRGLKRERGIEKFNLLQKRKRQERLNHLIDLYHRTSSFVTLNNLDSKIDEAFNKTQRVYTNTLDDMQMDYNEMGGGVSDEEVLKRLNQIYDILEGTSHGKKYPGSDQIIKPNPPPDSLGSNSKDKEYENKVKVEEIEKIDEETDLGLLSLLKDDEIDKTYKIDKID